MAEQKTQAPAKGAPAAPAAAPAAAGTPEVVKNCAGCNKPMKKAKRFYRNGKYYCTKKCAKTTIRAAVAAATTAAVAPKKE